MAAVKLMPWPVMEEGRGRAGGSAKVAKVLAFASFGLQILESVNCVHFMNYCVFLCCVLCILVLCIVYYCV